MFHSIGFIVWNACNLIISYFFGLCQFFGGVCIVWLMWNRSTLEAVTQKSFVKPVFLVLQSRCVSKILNCLLCNTANFVSKCPVLHFLLPTHTGIPKLWFHTLRSEIWRSQRYVYFFLRHVFLLKADFG